MVRVEREPDEFKRRMRTLPRLVARGERNILESAAHNHAAQVEKRFRLGIQQDLLHLHRLRPRTIAGKEAKGYSWPETPLVGEGPDDKRSYSEMMEVVKVANRMWVVRPKAGYHHSAEEARAEGRQPITLRRLFDVHEYGCIIANGFGRGIFILIPPRPAMRRAYEGYLREAGRKDPTARLTAAMGQYIQRGDAAKLREIRRKLEEGWVQLRIL